jgi:hypothetical protein
MLNTNPPVPENETARLIELSALDLDYSALENNFKDLTRLAAKITGAPVSLINLIDSFTQWTISKQGTPLQSMPREDSVCQYTIMGDESHFEVKDLTADDRFKDKFYVARPNGFKYYLGVPLRNQSGNSIGALCVLNTEKEELPAEKIELLKIIASEIVSRLDYLKKAHELSDRLTASQEEHKALARNVREPLAGISGILGVILDRAGEISLEEVLEYVALMQKSSEAILQLTEATLDSEEEKHLNEGEGDLIWLMQAIENLYGPICRKDNLILNITTSARTETIPFRKNKLLLIAGNLISYAIKHSLRSSIIDVDLSLTVEADRNTLHLEVSYFSTPDQVLTDVLKGGIENNLADGPAKQALNVTKSLVDEVGGDLIIDTIDQKIAVKVSIEQHQQ